MEMTQIDSMTFIVKIDGKEIPVPEEIGANDTAVRAALSPFYPGASNARLNRTVEGGKTIIEVVKQAGKLGSILDDLDRTPGFKDPAVKTEGVISAKLINLMGSSPEQIEQSIEEARQAIIDSEHCRVAVDRVFRRLCISAAQPGTSLIPGF